MKTGTSTFTATEQNLEDSFGNAEDKTVIGKSNALNIGQSTTYPISEFFSRPVQIASTSLTLGNTFFQVMKPWDQYTKDASVRAKLRNFAYLRGDLNLRFSVSASPFHLGKLLIAYIPYNLHNETIAQYIFNLAALSNARDAMLCYLSQQPGCKVVDIKMNTPLEMVLPFISPKPSHRLYNGNGLVSAVNSFDDLAEAGALYIMSLGDIEDVSASTATTPIFQLYAWMENAQLGSITATQMEITTESKEITDERETGPVEKFASSAVTVTESFSEIPVVGPYVMASSFIFKGISTLASLFGWSRPTQLTPGVFVKNSPYGNGCHGIGQETTLKLSLDPKQETSVDPRCVGVDTDDMVISKIANKESFFTSFNWATTDTPTGSSLFTMSVTPNVNSYVDTAANVLVQPTACGFAVKPFTYWRCDMIYRVEIVCSAYHRGKLLVYYDPNVIGFTTVEQNRKRNKQSIAIIDIQETQSFEFCVNWAAPRAWLRVGSDFNYSNSLSLKTQSVVAETHNGMVGIVPYTKLAGPTTTGIRVNMYCRARNLQVNFPTASNFPTSRPDTFVFTESSEIFTESSSQPAISSSDLAMTCYELNPPNASRENICIEHFGEQVLSFRTLLKRYVKNHSHSMSTDTSVSTSVTTLTFPAKWYNPLTYGTASSTMNSMFEYLQYAYLGYRGSIRRRVFANGFEDNDPYDVIQISWTPPTATDVSTLVTALDTVDTTLDAKLEGSIQYIANTNGGIEFDLPFLSPNLFHIACNDDSTAPNAMDAVFARNFHIAIPYVSRKNSILRFAIASGEDFSFLRFQGAPIYAVAL